MLTAFKAYCNPTMRTAICAMKAGSVLFFSQASKISIPVPPNLGAVAHLPLARLSPSACLDCWHRGCGAAAEPLLLGALQAFELIPPCLCLHGPLPELFGVPTGSLQSYSI